MVPISQIRQRIVNENSRILIIEDSEPMALAYAEFLKEEYLTHCTGDLSTTRSFLAEEKPLMLLLDVQLPDGNGIDLVRELRESGSLIPIVVMTSDGSIENAVSSIQAGADDFLEKPFSAERLRMTIANALEKRSLKTLVSDYESEGRDTFEGFIGSSLVMQGIYHLVESAAPSKATIFITGESGTGKEVLANAIHRRSPRRSKPFVALNCAAIPRELMESEVFGHVKGAFTGANKERKGAALQANEGTLFLDEVCEMDMDLQVKLLRFIQGEKFRPVGSDLETQVDVRIVCATNKNPMEEVKAGRFREDLYYRLHVIGVELPPLRERHKDVLLIAESLLLQYAEEESKNFHSFSEDSKTALLSYSWPGNVREMQNVVRQVVVLNDGEEVTVDMLSLPNESPAMVTQTETSRAKAPQHFEPVRQRLTESEIEPLWKVEERHIAAALALCGDSVPKAAALLEVSPSTLYRKLKQQE